MACEQHSMFSSLGAHELPSVYPGIGMKSGSKQVLSKVIDEKKRKMKGGKEEDFFLPGKTG